MYKNKNIHLFNMFDRTYAFDYNTNFVFSIDELSKKIIKGELTHNDNNKYDRNLIHKRQEFVKFLCDKNILSNGNGKLNSDNKKNKDFNLSAINLFLTNNCNLRCEYCFEKNNNKFMDMSEEIIKKSIDLLYRNFDHNKVPSIFFFGGEPLLKVKSIKYAENYINNYVKPFKCDYGITTNGTILNDDIYNLLENMNIRIMFSLDGSRSKQNLHRKFCNGKGSYDLIKKNIKKYYSNDLSKISIRNTITKQDLDYIDVYRFFKSNNFKNLISIPVSSSDVNVKLSKNDIDIIIKNSIKIAEEALDDILNEKEVLKTNFFYYASLYPTNVSNHYCGAGIKSISIDTNGDIYTCHRFVGNDKFKWGNILDNDIDKKINKLQSSYEDRNKYLIFCEDCWAFNLCKGGCMHENLIENCNINNTNHNLCNLRRAWYEISIAMYAIICELNPKMIKEVFGCYVFENFINRWIPLNID